MKILYLDESGDHDLVKIDPKYPIFVLGGVIVDRTYMRTVVRPRLREFKSEFFADPTLVLHTTDIVRARNGFERLGQDPGFRAAFYDALGTLMTELDYTVIACVIKKPEFVAAHGALAGDPYLESLHVLVDRFCEVLGEVHDAGFICAEKRNPLLDDALSTAWERLQDDDRDTEMTSGAIASQRIVDLSLKSKRLNIDGLQLADLVVAPIGRAMLGFSTRGNWEIVARKLYRGADGAYNGYGLIVRP